MPVKHEMTRDSLMSAFGGEAMAHMRYLIFAETAEREGYRNVGRLFRAIAHAEYVHARNHSMELSQLRGGFNVVAGATFGPGDTVKNLELAIMGEEFEVAEMYPVYVAIAEHQGETGAKRSFTWALEAEKIHAELFKEAKRAVEDGRDYSVEGKIWICDVCGHTHVGVDAPEKCPVCGAPKSRFKDF